MGISLNREHYVTNKAFYDGEMESLRLAIIECIGRQMEFMSSQGVYLVLHPIAEEFRIMYQTELTEQFREKLQARDDSSTAACNSRVSMDSSIV